MRHALTLSAAALLFAGAFVWGFATNRHQVFPYHWLRTAALRFGAVEHEPSKRQLVEPRFQQTAALQSLPYATASYDPDREAKGVVVHDRERAFPGYNLYNSKRRRQAFLLDMDGGVVHRWRYGGEPAIQVHLELLPRTGELLVLVHEQALLKLDRDSNLLWRYPARVHHDLWREDDGDIYLLTRESRPAPEVHAAVDVLEDFVTVLDAQGEEKDRLSVYELVRDSPYAYLLPSLGHVDFPDARSPGYGGSLDILHTNHVEVFDGRLADRSELFAAGHLLLSMRHLNAIAIADPVERRLLWLWGPTNLALPHHPTLLDNGHLLVFDNGTEASRVIELDPLERRIAWSYGPREGFFSRTRGGNQRLPNGNTLITESDRGYVFEVTPEGETVWKFANPEIDDKGYRQSLWRMTRFAAADLEFLGDAPADRTADEPRGR